MASKDKDEQPEVREDLFSELVNILNNISQSEKQLDDLLKVVASGGVGAGPIQHNVEEQLKLRQQARVDPLSGLVLCHMSLVLNMFLPEWLLKGPLLMWQDRYVNAVCPGLDDPVTEEICAGSLPDGISVPAYQVRHAGQPVGPSDVFILEQLRSDIDILKINKSLVLTADQIDTTSSYPGYFKTKLPYFDLIFRMVPDIILKGINKGDPDDLIICGPALAQPVLDPTSIVDHTDHVTTYRFDSWPEPASEWITRNRFCRWPPQDLIQDIISDGCYFVDKAHPLSEDPRDEWRFSLVIAEQKLIRSLSFAQRQSYVICKLLVKYLLNPSMSFSSYCVKSTFLWTLESIPERVWRSQNSGISLCVFTILDKLIQFLTEHNVPAYFIPEGNLIEHVPRASIKRDLHKLVSFREDPLKLLLEFDSKYVVQLARAPGGISCSIVEAFNSESPHTFCATKKLNCDLKSCLRQQHDLILDKLLFHLETHTILGASEAARELHSLVGMLTYNYNKPHMSWLIEEFSDCHKRLWDETLKSRFSPGNVLGSLAGVIALNFLQSHKTDDALVSHISDCFETALKFPSRCSHAHKTYYAMFLLCVKKNQKKVAELLEEATSYKPFGEEFMSTFVYALKDSPLLDRKMLNLITICRVCFTPPLFAYYVLVDTCYKHNSSRREELLRRFHQYANQHATQAPGRSKELYMALAVTYITAGDIESAATVLQTPGVLPKSQSPGNFIEQLQSTMS